MKTKNSTPINKKQEIDDCPQIKNVQNDQITKYRIMIFMLTYGAYSMIHSTRTVWSSSKLKLKKELKEKDDHFLGLVDTCFLLSYAISMKLLGSYCSKFPIQYTLGIGMVGAACCFLIIYFTCQVNINKVFIVIIMIINGISQSFGWPAVVACIGNWFGHGKKGLLMGFWGTSSNFGNIIGYFIQDLTVNSLDLNWKFVFFLNGILLFILGSYVIFYMKPYPQELKISQMDLAKYDQNESEVGCLQKSNNNNNNNNNSNNDKTEQFELNPDFYVKGKENQRKGRAVSLLFEKQPINFAKQEVVSSQIKQENEQKNECSQNKFSSFDKNQRYEQADDINKNVDILEREEEDNDNNGDGSNKKEEITIFNALAKVPGLGIFALTQGGVKGTVYGLLFWLPIYLQQKGFKESVASICTMNEIGTIGGGILLGYFIDKFKIKGTLISSFLILSSIFMLIIYYLPSKNVGAYYFFVFLVGISIGGPYSMLGGTIAIELAQQPGVIHQKNITVIISGIIEGFGSFIAALVQIIVPFIGQEHIFIFFFFSVLMTSCFLIPRAFLELKDIFQR